MFFKLLLNLFAFFIFITNPSAAFAGDPPQLSSPSNSSTVSSSKLEWQAPSYALYSGNNYRVQVDDDSSFASLNKDYYTDNTYYSPSLSDGTWYWKVKAKDAGGVWSDWSSVWSFTLTSNSPTPTSSPTPTNSDPAPTPTPTPTSTPTPQPISSSQSSSFLISNVPSQINSDQSFSVSIDLILPNNPDTKFYLKGAFKKSDGSNYFGFTKAAGSWVKNGSSYSSQFPITTDSSGNWSGNLEVKVDSEDSGFTGGGDYIFKVGRYTSSGSGPTWSNEVTIKIIAVGMETNNEGGTSGSNTAKTSPKPTSTPTNSTKKLTTNSLSVIKLPKTSQSYVASVAGVQTSTTSPPTSEVLSKKEINYIPWIGGGFILAGLSSLVILYLKNKGFYGNFFKRIR